MNSTTAPQPAGIALPRHAPAAARSALRRPTNDSIASPPAKNIPDSA